MAAENKNYNKDGFSPEKDAEDKYDPLDIWRVNPAYKDISSTQSNIKMIFLLSLTLFLTISTYILTYNLSLALILTLIIVILFFAAFHREFYYLENGFKHKLRFVNEIKPFENFKFYRLKEDPTTVLIINKKDMLTIATRIFKVEVLAENVHPTINQFLYALDQSKTPYSYQVVQKPIIKSSERAIVDRKIKLKSGELCPQFIDSYETHIFFSVYHMEKGILTNRKLSKLVDTIILYSKDLKSNFAANFHHIKISLLNDPIDAIRTVICKRYIEEPNKRDNSSKPKSISLSEILRVIFCVLILAYLTIVLVVFEFTSLFILIFDLTVICIIIFLWWREILFQLTRLQLNNSVLLGINPFTNTRFYLMKNLIDTLYIHINEEILIASKLFHLRNAIQPSFAMPDKFFSAMINQNTPFIYTLNAIPIERKDFSKECSNKLNEKAEKELDGILFHHFDKPTKRYKYPDAEYFNWIEKRTGIWKTFLTISTSSYKFTNASTIGELIKDFYELEDKLYYNAKNMMNVFQKNFKKLMLTPLQGQLLISGFHSECIKNASSRLGGTHLTYVYFQGKKLKELTNLAHQFKKGIDTRIAAEFNTPLHLENFITIGHTINTEYLENETPSGFTLNQLKQLLITNGISEDREFLKMKIAAELIKANISCVIFDYTGEWSRLIRTYENSRLEDSFLHFKLGQSFNLNLINSGIEYESNNLEYLSYFYDAFALAFKASKHTIDLLQKTIRENQKLDWGSIALDVEVKQTWAKNYHADNLVNLFKDFLDQSVFFSDKALEYENDIAPLDFIKSDKTVIIDFSLLKNLEQKTFAAFVILSKFIHYTNHSRNYHKKIFCIPHIDLFFDQQYIDYNKSLVNYSKINKFLKPLLQRGFGFIFSANQIHYLHPNLFNYVRNIITFQATDSRDIAVIKNNLCLQDLHGTGYYSSKRNETYQIQYLMSMRNHEVIVKRDDIYQPYPVEIDCKKLVKTLPLSDEKIYSHMKRQGYNLKQSEKKLRDKLKETIFEKDFGIYSDFIEDIKLFLNAIKTIHNIGNLPEKKLKTELLKYIYRRASKRTSNKRVINAIRDDIFNILIVQRYLVESHPRTASGGESTRTSYMVGEQYEKALNDEFESKRNKVIKIEVEPITTKNKANTLEILKSYPFQEEFNDLKFSKALLDQKNQLYFKLFEIFKFNSNKEFEKSIDLGKNLIRSFFIGLQNTYDDQGFDEFGDFIKYLIKNKKIPLTGVDLKNYMEQIEMILNDNIDLKTKASKLYNLSSDFYARFDNQIALST